MHRYRTSHKSLLVTFALFAIFLITNNEEVHASAGDSPTEAIPIFTGKEASFDVPKGESVANLVGITISRYQGTTANSMVSSEYTSKVEIEGMHEWFVDTTQATDAGEALKYTLMFDKTAVQRTLFSSYNTSTKLGLTSHNLVEHNSTFKLIITPIYRLGSGSDLKGTPFEMYFLLNHAPILTATSVNDQTLHPKNTLLKLTTGGTVFDEDEDETITAFYQIKKSDGTIMIPETKLTGDVSINQTTHEVLESWMQATLTEEQIKTLGTSNQLLYEFYVKDKTGAKSNSLNVIFSVDVTSPTISIGSTKDKIVVAEDFNLQFSASATDIGDVKVDEVDISFKLYKNSVRPENQITCQNCTITSMNVLPLTGIFFDTELTMDENPAGMKAFTDGGLYILEVTADDRRNPPTSKQIRVKVDSTGLTEPSGI